MGLFSREDFLKYIFLPIRLIELINCCNNVLNISFNNGTDNKYCKKRIKYPDDRVKQEYSKYISY